MLDKNWITQNNTDLEYKQYILLAYLKRACSFFDQSKIYPVLSELGLHYQNLLTLSRQKNELQTLMKKEVKGIDWEKMELKYDTSYLSQWILDINDIIQFSVPRLERALNYGEQLAGEVASKLLIEPVGIVPLYQKEGYLLLQNSTQSPVLVYQYSNYALNNRNDIYHYNYQYVGSYEHGISHTYEYIKSDLRTKNKNIPVPATYLVLSEQKLPLRATFLPTSYRLFEKYHQKAIN